MQAAEPATTPASQPDAIAEPSAAERLFSTLGAFWRNINALDGRELALNIGLTALAIVGLFVAVFVLRRMLHGLLGRLPRHLDGEEAADESADAEPPRIERLTLIVIQAVAAIAAVVIVLSIWGIDLLGWLASSGVGVAALRVGVIALIAVFLIEVSDHLVGRVLTRLSRRLNENRRRAQVKTLGPLIRGSLKAFILILATLTVLSELGVKIGPLLASAGVVGIAVGFGAQTLVKDVLTGFFLVVEDIVAIGDYVVIGEFSGAVEAMTLRTMRVRATDGTLHVLPYSEAQIISNQSQSFSAYVFQIGIGYGDDIDHAFDVMRRVGAEMQADETFGGRILQPLEIMGVDALADSAVILKARFKTHPGQQWGVGREFNKRIKQAFDAEGIDLPYPHRKLVFDQALTVAQQPKTSPDGKGGKPEPQGRVQTVGLPPEDSED